MKHRFEHETLIRQRLLGQITREEEGQLQAQLAECEACRETLSSLQTLQGSLEQSGREFQSIQAEASRPAPELAAMEENFRREAMKRVLPQEPSKVLRFARPWIAVAAVFVLAVIGIFFLQPTPSDPGSGVLGSEIRFLLPLENEKGFTSQFQWQAPGSFDRFQLRVSDSQGKILIQVEDILQTRYELNPAQRSLLSPGVMYSAVVTAKNPRPGQPDLVSAPRKFSPR